jgi:hypothetical protein
MHVQIRGFFAVSLLLLIVAGCTSRVPGTPLFLDDDGGVTSDPSCPDPSSIVPDITCGSPRPDVSCMGSCAQTLDGIVGVGLSTCTCMDTGSGFGAQWVCDTTACDDPSMGDAGTGPVDPPADSGTPPSDAAVSCPPATFTRPTEPGCSIDQLYEIMRIETQSDYDAFVADSANTECNTCLSLSALACATSLGCDDSAGELLCCLDDECGEDEACRDAAFTGACRSEADSLSYCVGSVPSCGLNPLAPPSECFP